jgi:hypothetical protein
MAKQGVIPRRLCNCPIPTCSTCLYAKASQRPWRSWSANNKEEAREPLKPGEVVSMDQMVSPTPGLIAQITGWLMMLQYRYATVFIDQASGLGFVYLQKTASADDTIEAKKAWEEYAHL